MGRIIQTGETAAKRRHAHQRSCAEVLRLLAQRDELAHGFDAEARDMAAFLVFNLRGIYQSVEESAQAWDEKNYWRKAEALRARWLWSRDAARDLEALLLEEAWADVPPRLVALVPRFSDVTVRQVTRDAGWWCGAFRALKRQAAAA